MSEWMKVEWSQGLQGFPDFWVCGWTDTSSSSPGGCSHTVLGGCGSEIDLPRPNRDGVSAHKLLRMPIKQGFLRQTAARLMSHWHHLHVLYIKPVYIAWLGFNRPCNGKGPLKEFLTENKPCPHSPAAALNLSSCAGFPCLPLIHHFLSLLSCACPFGIQHYSPSQPPFYHSRSPAFGGTPLHQLCRGGKGEKHLRTEM